MTLVPINPNAGGPAVAGGGIDAIFSRLTAQIIRLDQRTAALEATRGNLGENSVGGGQIGPNQIDGQHIAPSSITTAMIVAGSIDASVINANSVAAAVGDFISINADQIVAGNIAAEQMTANWLLAGQAAISTLSAITSNMGAITAGNITGATIRTAAGSVARVVMDSSGLRGYGLDGVTKTFEIDNGTGIASFTGVANLDASSVVPGGAVLSGTLPGDAIVNGTITGVKIAAGTIEANNIKAGTITAQSIGLEVGSNNVLYNSSFEDTTASGGTIPRWTTVGQGTVDIYADTPGVQIFGGRAARLTGQSVEGPPTGGAAVAAAGGDLTEGTYYFKLSKLDSSSVETQPSPEFSATVPFVALNTPANLTGAEGSTFGSLITGGDYTYLVTAVDPKGRETLAAGPITVNAGNNQSIDLSWSRPANAAAGSNVTYYVYRSNGAGGYGVMSAGGTAFTDDGSGGWPARTLPTAAAAAVGYKITVSWNEAVQAYVYRSTTSGTYTQRTSIRQNSPFTDTDHITYVTASPSTTGQDGIAKDLGLKSDSVPVIPNHSYTASAYVYPGDATVANGLFDLIVEWLDSSGAVISTDTGQASFGTDALTVPFTVPATIVDVSGAWKRISLSPTSPANASAARVTVKAEKLGGGRNFLLDGVQLESGNSPSGYAPRADEILTYQVGPTQIAPDSITTDKVVAGSLNATDITVTNLSALSANMGSITAGTITGATIQTAASGARAVMNSSGFTYYNSGGTAIFSASGGTVSVTGTITASAMNFTNLTYGTNVASSYMRWYTGNFAAQVGYMGLGADGSNTVSENLVQINGGGGAAEWRWISKNSSSGEAISLSMQHNSSAPDFFRLYYTPPGGASRNLLQISESGGDMTFFYDQAGTSPKLWMNRATYMHVTENYGWVFNNGNNQNQVYGGSGAAHVVVAGAGNWTGGATYTSGYSYALLHSNYSDERLKYNIRDVDEFAALSRIRALRPVKFAYKGGNVTGVNQMGFIAQEVQEIIPEAIELILNGDTGETTYTMDNTAIIAQLVAAVQELAEAVNVLRGAQQTDPLTRDNVLPIQANPNAVR